MYFLDADEGAQRRYSDSEDILCIDLIKELEVLLRSINPYAIGYVHLRERYVMETELQIAQGIPMPKLLLEFVHVHGRESRNFDLPSVQEIAIVHTYDDELLPTKNMRVFLRDRPHRFIEIFDENPLSDPLSFPLLFSTGEQGWHHSIYRLNNHTKVTLADYYSYRFAYRTMPQQQFHIFQHSGKLFQQFVVASYTKIESNRLQYIVQNQNRLRSELYNGLADYLQQHANQNDAHLGRMVILPSTYIGSPRNMMELFQDILAIVQKFDQPSLFITLTCNPKWPDIINNIPAGEEPSNHPLLVARVFKSMLKQLLDDLDNGQVMGVSIGRLYVIEFQKRGLPHAHLLIILRQQDRMEEAFRIDSLIRAELPDVKTEPRLYNLICTHNIHGPCYTNSICMEKGKCSKHFPKSFAEETTISDKGFVTYKRRDDGRIAIIRKNYKEFRFDNRWVVPYNSYLTLKYSCHINVEACPSTRAITYLYKYVWKGVDKCLIRLRTDGNIMEYNEVNAYISARYLAPLEASWRILKFPLHDNTHTVIRLPVHLPQQQNVIFQENDIQGAMDRYIHTHLTRWFELNSNDANARQFLYSEIPLHYVWNNNNRNWSMRQRNAHNIVSRMYAVSPRQGELYYLRLLLLHVRGALNWEHIRTVDRQVCHSFREACSKMNLLLEDLEWVRCLTEARHTRMAYQIRQLFVCILVFCEIGNPLGLWEQFCDCMMDDFLHANENLQRETALQMALIDLQRALSVHNKYLAEYNLPQPQVNLILNEHIDVLIEQSEGMANSNRLNHEQRLTYDAILQAVHSNQLRILPPSERLFVVDSAGGTGKSFLFNTLILTLAGEEIAVLSCCFSGIGATILKRGKTIHSAFKLKLNPDETTTSGVRPNSTIGRFLVGVGLIIIDEISMVSRVILNIIDKALKDITGNDSYFGGKVILLGGDFRQLLPVMERANRPLIVSQCIKNSTFWPLFTQLLLHTNLRTLPEEVEFREWLLQLGNGTLPTFIHNNFYNLILIPDGCVVQNKERLIEICFEAIQAHEYRNVAILTPKNDDCDYINGQVLNLIQGELKMYHSADILDEHDAEALEANYTTEYLNTLKPPGFPPYNLQLKVGAVVLLLRNLNIRQN